MKNLMNKTLRGILALLISCCYIPYARAADSTLTKTGTDNTTGSSAVSSGGGLINWVLGYNNTSAGPVSTVVHDVLPDGATFVPSSLQTPAGWSTSYSQDNGVSYSATDLGAATTDIEASAQLPQGGPGSGQQAPQPVSATQQSGTGYDAYMPIPYGDRVFGIVHHSTQVGKELVCSMRSGGDCTGYPLALDVAGQTDFFTSINPMHYVDANGKLFFAIQRTNGFGVFCYDLANNANCATPYTQWSASGGVLGAEQPSRILGVVEQGGCLYGWDTDLIMYTLDPVTLSTTCGSFGARNLATGYSLPTYNPSTHNFSPINYGPVASGQVIQGKLYFPVNYSFNDGLNLFCGFGSTNFCENSRLVCFDPLSANGVCSSWVPPSLGGANTPAKLVTTVLEDKTNQRPCTVMVDASPGVYSSTLACFNATTGSSVTAPSNLQASVINDASILSGESGSNIYLMSAYEEVSSTLPNGHVVTVMPFTKFSDSLGNTIRGGAGCYDWNTADECAGWGSNSDGETSWTAWGSSLAVNGGDTRDYGYAVDDAGCLLGLGDAGWLWSFNVDDGSVPCRRSVSQATIDPSGYYCDSSSGHATGWDKVTVSNVTLADFSSMLVTVRDSNGDIVSGYDALDILPSSGSLDISGIPFSGTTAHISVTVTLVAQNDNPWSDVSPFVGVTFAGDDAQICFQTVSSDSCQLLNLLNEADEQTIELSDASTHSSVASHALTITHDSVSCPITDTPPASNGAASTGLLAKTGSTYLLAVPLLGVSLVTVAVVVSRRRRNMKWSR